MKNINLIRQLAEKNEGIVRFADLKSINIGYRTTQRMIRNGILSKIGHNMYLYTFEQPELNETELVGKLFSDGILCMQSALYYYGFIDQQPDCWHIAFAKDVSKGRFKIDRAKIQPYYYEPIYLEYGVEQICLGNQVINIFSRERLLCECLLFINKMNMIDFQKVAARYFEEKGTSLCHLLLFAHKRHVLHKFSEYLGIDLEW